MIELEDGKRSQRKDMKKRSNLTSYCPSLLGIFSADEEDHVPLGSIDIVVLKEEDFVYAIFLQCAELDEQTDCSSQGLLDD
jgi:hypothetical protein